MSSFHILVTTDLSDESTRAFESVAKLARALHARITLFHAIRDPFTPGAGLPTVSVPAGPELDEYLSQASDRLVELRMQLPEELQVIVQTGVGEQIETVVTNYAEQHGVDLIAMATHGRSGLRRALMGSVAEAVLRRARTPVLMFPPTD